MSKVMSTVTLSNSLNDGANSNILTMHTLSSETALSNTYDTEDHVMTILHSESLEYQDVEALVVGLNPQRAQDILMSYRILSTLTQYLEETNSWTFCLLNNYDFQTNVRQFDLDVAIVVGKRAEHLLAEIYAWNIPRLKKMVSSFSAYYSDEATILTVIIFRIVSKYSDLEFTLQLALSRATLIKIHYEMTGLFSKLPGENETNTPNGKHHADLVSAYRQFVTQLLNEIESSPFESVQQELFQVVRDLSSMFSKFSDSQMLKSLEGAGTEYDSFYDNPQAPPVSSTSRLPPLAENDYLNENSTTAYLKPNGSQNNHRRTFSNSTMFSATTAASARTTISEELPAMMQAFEVAKKREEYAKLHSTPPETPIRTNGNFNGNHKTPTSPSSSQSVMSSPSSTTSTTHIRSQNQPWSSASTVSHSRKSTSPPSVAGSLGSAMVVKQPETPAEGNMQVKMISNRMMILVDGKYIDMQEWAEKVNSNSQPHQMSMPIPTIHGPASPAPSIASSVVSGAAGAPANFGLGTLFQPWLRPAVTNKPLVIDDPSSDSNKKQQLVVKKDKRVAKAQSIDNILAKQNNNKPTSTLDLLRSSSIPQKSNTLSSLNGFAAANRISGGIPGASAATATTASGFSTVGAVAGNSTTMGGSWIKSMLGKAEDQFEKNYKTNMDF